MYQTRSEDVSEARAIETRVLVLLSLVQGYLTTLRIDTSLVLSLSFESQASVHKFTAILRTQDTVRSDSTPFHANTHIDCILHPPSSRHWEGRMRVTRVRVTKEEFYFLFVRKFMATSLPGLTSILIEHISSLVPASAASGGHVGRFQSIWYLFSTNIFILVIM